MNNSRRKDLRGIIDQIEELKGLLEDLMCEEEEFRDNIPENLQGSERYEKSDAACNDMQDALIYLDDAATCIEAAIGD